MQQKNLTFDDVFILPNYSDCNSRNNCDISPKSIPWVTLPIISANMNAVSGKRMCETLWRYGWISVLPQDMSFDEKKRIIEHINNRGWEKFHFDTPMYIEKGKGNISEIWRLMNKRAHKCVIIVDENKNPIGYIPESPLLLKESRIPIAEESILPIDNATFNLVKNDDVYTFVNKKGETFLTYQELYNHLVHIKELNAFIFKDGVFLGLLNANDIIRKGFFSAKRSSGLEIKKDDKINVAVAVGVNQMFQEGMDKEIIELYHLGVETFVLDTAHWHQEKMIQAIKKIREIPELWDKIHILAGNVCTKEATKDLLEAGANGVKVGIWPWAMCTTRMMTWVGRPQFSAILECAEEAKKHNGYVVADGGVKYVRDFCLALLAGAEYVMLGTMFSWTKESVGEIFYDEDDKLFKRNFGMASSKAVVDRNNNVDFFTLASRNLFNEGISTSKIYLREWMATVGEVCEKLISWLKSSLSYSGAKTLKEFTEKGRYGVQNSSWFKEGTPHWEKVS